MSANANERLGFFVDGVSKPRRDQANLRDLLWDVLDDAALEILAESERAPEWLSTEDVGRVNQTELIAMPPFDTHIDALKAAIAIGQAYQAKLDEKPELEMGLIPESTEAKLGKFVTHSSPPEIFPQR